MMKKRSPIITFFGILIVIAFVLILFLPLFSTKTPVVTHSDPQNNEEEVSQTKGIDIIFAIEPKDKAKNNIKVTIDPSIDFDSTWVAAAYKIIPKNKLAINTNYKVNVSYKDKSIYAFSFTTQTFSKEDVEKYGPLQSGDDYDYGQALNKIIEKYPFYPYLPIRTNDFTIYYDFEKEKFSIDLLKDNLNKVDRQEAINKALESLRRIGAKDPIPYYIFTPGS